MASFDHKDVVIGVLPVFDKVLTYLLGGLVNVFLDGVLRYLTANGAVLFMIRLGEEASEVALNEDARAV